MFVFIGCRLPNGSIPCLVGKLQEIILGFASHISKIKVSWCFNFKNTKFWQVFCTTIPSEWTSEQPEVYANCTLPLSLDPSKANALWFSSKSSLPFLPLLKFWVPLWVEGVNFTQVSSTGCGLWIWGNQPHSSCFMHAGQESSWFFCHINFHLCLLFLLN